MVLRVDDTTTTYATVKGYEAMTDVNTGSGAWPSAARYLYKAANSTPVGWAASLTRNLLRAVDMLPFAYCVGAVSSLSHPSFKRLGDLAAGTLVVYRDEPPKRPQLPEADAERAPFSLSLVEQRALLDFAERSADLSAARRAELAGILAEPLESLPEQTEKRLHGIARGLLGSA